MSSGLVQFTTVWRAKEPAQEGALCTERCRSSTHHDHITPVLCQLHSLQIHRQVEFKITCRVHQSLALTQHRRTLLSTFECLQAYSITSPFLFLAVPRTCEVMGWLCCLNLAYPLADFPHTGENQQASSVFNISQFTNRHSQTTLSRAHSDAMIAKAGSAAAFIWRQ